MKWAHLAAPFAVGTALRLFRVQEQPLTGDEMHVFRVAVAWPLEQIARSWTYFGADYCVPLGLINRATLEHGASLSEMGMRAPALLAGLALLLLAPMLLARRIGQRAAVLLAWLLAVSPLLVLYSRIIRGYMPVVLLGFGAVMAFHAFWYQRRAGAAVSYSILAPLAIYFHLPVAPLVLAPLAWAGIEIALSWRERRSGIPRLAAVAAATALVTTALLAPAFDSLLALRDVHGDGGIPGPGAWFEVIRLQAGTSQTALAIVVVAALARGAWLLARSEPEFARYLAALVPLHLLGLAILGPDQLDNPIVINRYLLALLPFGLALVALGASAPIAFAASARAQRVGVYGLLAAVFATGPLASHEFRSSSFVHAAGFLHFTQPGNRIDTESIPHFYRDNKDRGALIEFPWLNLASHAFDAYQKVHGRPLVLASLGSEFEAPGVAMRNTITGRPAAFLASGAHHLVVHRNMKREEARVLSNDPHHWRRIGEVAAIWQPALKAGPAMERHLRRTWGPPFYSDGDIAVWDIVSVRRELSARRE